MDKLQEFHTQVHRYLVSKRILIWGHPQKTSSLNGQFWPPTICFSPLLLKCGLSTKSFFRYSVWNDVIYGQPLIHTTPSHVAEKYMANFFEEQQGECWIEASNFWNCTWCFGKIPIMLLVFRPYHIELNKTSFV